jgi:hypothetical protein
MTGWLLCDSAKDQAKEIVGSDADLPTLEQEKQNRLEQLEPSTRRSNQQQSATVRLQWAATVLQTFNSGLTTESDDFLTKGCSIIALQLWRTQLLQLQLGLVVLGADHSYWPLYS